MLDKMLRTRVNPLYFMTHSDNIVSSRVSAPHWNIDLAPFYLGPQKIPKSVRAPFMSNSPQNFGELSYPPLEMYPRPKKERLIF